MFSFGYKWAVAAHEAFRAMPGRGAANGHPMAGPASPALKIQGRASKKQGLAPERREGGAKGEKGGPAPARRR